jgi:hypothetical protein
MTNIHVTSKAPVMFLLRACKENIQNKDIILFINCDIVAAAVLWSLQSIANLLGERKTVVEQLLMLTSSPNKLILI